MSVHVSPCQWAKSQTKFFTFFYFAVSVDTKKMLNCITKEVTNQTKPNQDAVDY